MIADLEEFKRNRAEVFASGDVAKIRAWAKLYSVALPVDDAEVLRLVKLCPVWD